MNQKQAQTLLIRDYFLSVEPDEKMAILDDLVVQTDEDNFPQLVELMKTHPNYNWAGFLDYLEDVAKCLSKPSNVQLVERLKSEIADSRT